MNLLKAALYDPAVAVSKATSSLLAMTALDTTNLRLAITVPAHGMVRFKMRGVVTGATTTPTIMLGVLNGATVVGRVTPCYENATANAATQSFVCDAEFTATGLTPGAMNVDAAYAVQVVVASTNIKYGGPNTNAGANAWGAFLFEAWDPQPLQTTGQLVIDASGRVDVSKVAGTAQTARDLGAQLDAAVSTRMATFTQPTGFLAATFPVTVASTTNITAGTIATVTNLTNLPAIPANWITAAGITAAALNGKGDWNIGKTGYSLTQAFPTNFAAMSLTVGGLVTLAGVTHTGAVIPTVSAVTGLTASNLDATVSSRSTYAGGAVASVTGDVGGNVVGSVASVTGNVGGNVTGSVGSLGVQAKLDVNAEADTALFDVGLTSIVTSRLDAAVSSRSTYAGADTAGTATLLARLTAGRALALDYLDAAVTSRAAASDLAVVAGYVDTEVGAIKAKTDLLTFTVAGHVDVNVRCVNAVSLLGTGAAGDLFRVA